MKLKKKTRILLIVIITAIVFLNTSTAAAQSDSIQDNADEIAAQAFSAFSLVVIIGGTVIVISIMAFSLISHKRRQNKKDD